MKSCHWQRVLLLLVAIFQAGCGETRFQALEAQDFTLPSLDGAQSLSLGDYRGDVVYLTFWASWCVPCLQEMPYLAQLWERHHGDGFQVLAVNVEEDVAAARAFVEGYELPFPVLRDEGRKVSAQYRVPGYPTHYVIDRRGDIRYSGMGFNLNDVAAVSQEVETLLQESGGEAD